MSVSRKALLEWIDENWEHERIAVGSEHAPSQVRCELWREIRDHIESLPSSESEGEVYRAADEILTLRTENEQLQGEAAKLREENERLRAALVATEQALRVLDKYGERPTNLSDVYAQADEALSTSETAVRGTCPTCKVVGETTEEYEKLPCPDCSGTSETAVQPVREPELSTIAIEFFLEDRIRDSKSEGERFAYEDVLSNLQIGVFTIPGIKDGREADHGKRSSKTDEIPR